MVRIQAPEQCVRTMNTPETQPQMENEPFLSTKEGIDLQLILIQRSGLDLENWTDRFAARFRELVEGSATLRRLIRNNPNSAIESIERLLVDNADDKAA